MHEFSIPKLKIGRHDYWLDLERHRLVRVICGGDGPTEEPAPPAPAEGDTPAPDAEPEPDDPNAVVLTELSDEDLTAAEETLNAAFAAIFDAEGDPTADQVAQMADLADQIEAVRAEGLRRAEEAEANRVAAEEIASRVRPPAEEAAPEPVVTPEPEAVLVTAAATVPAEDVLPPARRRLNLSLAEIRARAPEVVIDTPRPTHTVTITAAGDVNGFSPGAEFPDVKAVAAAFQSKARAISTTALGEGAPRAEVMQIHREHAITLGDEVTDEQLAQIMGRVTDVESLVAAGGWCGPSTVLYDLFNISSDDGMVDLPTVGITRGGIKVPTSPALADFLANIWLWTEADDIAAVTGTGTKPCVRVPCPTWPDTRLEAHGLCVTAGMLTDSAYPEGTVNFVKLLMDAHRHVMNARHLANMEALSSALTLLSPADGAAANLLAGVDLGAVDYREKFGMAEDSILELVLPRWAKGVVRSDIARRMGMSTDGLAVTDAQVAEWFDARNVRTQFVSDWQTRGVGAPGTATPGVIAPLTAWPTTAKFMLYAAGTFILGEGPTITSGPIKDSVLNSKNDMTAAWTEEGSLVAKAGHESRVYTVKVCPDGVTGAGVNVECPAA